MLNYGAKMINEKSYILVNVGVKSDGKWSIGLNYMLKERGGYIRCLMKEGINLMINEEG